MTSKKLGIRRNLKEDKRREAIISAAIKLFSEKGFDQTVMDDIGHEAGCSKSLIYLYYQNKAGIFKELVKICSDRSFEFMDCVIGSDEPYPDRLYKLIVGYARLNNENSLLFRVVHYGSLHYPKSPDEDFRILVNEFYSLVLKKLEDFAQEGIDAGFLRPDLKAKILANYILTFIEGYNYMSILEERVTLDEFINEMFKMDLLKVFLKDGN